jgi:hypothetical protein
MRRPHAVREPSMTRAMHILQFHLPLLACGDATRVANVPPRRIRITTRARRMRILSGAFEKATVERRKGKRSLPLRKMRVRARRPELRWPLRLCAIESSVGKTVRAEKVTRSAGVRVGILHDIGLCARFLGLKEKFRYENTNFASVVRESADKRATGSYRSSLRVNGDLLNLRDVRENGCESSKVPERSWADENVWALRHELTNCERLRLIGCAVAQQVPSDPPGVTHEAFPETISSTRSVAWSGSSNFQMWNRCDRWIAFCNQQFAQETGAQRRRPLKVGGFAKTFPVEYCKQPFGAGVPILAVLRSRPLRFELQNQVFYDEALNARKGTPIVHKTQGAATKEEEKFAGMLQAHSENMHHPSTAAHRAPLVPGEPRSRLRTRLQKVD